MEKSGGFGAERAHEGKGTVDDALSFGDDDFVLRGDHPTVSTAVSMPTIGDEINCVVSKSLKHCFMISLINDPGEGVAYEQL